jgi:NAD(P)-dependent dehydrogenase (short-subunit alcohol dehydrogenase family)
MNRVIVITGANHGIGLAMTQSLLELGDCVTALDLDTDNLVPPHPSLLPFRCDVTNPQQIQLVADEVVRKWGKIDVLINNACLALSIRFEERSIDIPRIRELLRYPTVRFVLPVMKSWDAASYIISVRASVIPVSYTTGYLHRCDRILTRTLAGIRLTRSSSTSYPPLTRKNPLRIGCPT